MLIFTCKINRIGEIQRLERSAWRATVVYRAIIYAGESAVLSGPMGGETRLIHCKGGCTPLKG